MTGLWRPTVNAIPDRLLASRLLERRAQGRSFIYIPMVKFFNRSEMLLVKKFNRSRPQLVKKFNQSETQLVKNFYQLQPESEESERELINNLSIKDSLSDSLNPESSKKILLLQELQACGVCLKTTRAIVDRHDEGAIEQQRLRINSIVSP